MLHLVHVAIKFTATVYKLAGLSTTTGPEVDLLGVECKGFMEVCGM